MREDDDVLKRIIDQVRIVMPDAPEEKLYLIAAGIARDIGGERHYIPKRPAMRRVANAIAKGHKVLQAITVASKEAPLRTGCRIRKRGRLL